MPRAIRRATLLIFTAGIWAFVFAGADTLTVTIANVHKGEGSVMVQVASSEAEFKDEAEPVAAIMQDELQHYSTCRHLCSTDHARYEG
jgi:uncharacterized protein (DUF2141 family)